MTTGTALPRIETFHPTGHETRLERNDLFPRPVEPGEKTPSYYDIPLLKKPVWSWEIGVYFFLGGVSAGSYLLARVADRVGGERYRAVTRAGTVVAATALAPCPLLLIADLGDPTRFHHMLRVFKPGSPMNLGTWVMTTYSGVVLIASLREFLRWRRPNRREGSLLRMGMAVADLGGLPLAMLFSGYTGVLLSGTATPVWTKNKWLGPLFAAAAIGDAASATALALEVQSQSDENKAASAETLEQIGAAAHIAEGAAMVGYLTEAGPLAQPLTAGRCAPYFWGAVAGAVTAEVVRHLPVSPRAKRWTRLAAAALDLASGFCLKWGMYRAGPPSAADPEADRQASRPRRLER